MRGGRRGRATRGREGRSCVSLARPDPHGVWMVGGAALGGRPVSPDRSCGKGYGCAAEGTRIAQLAAAREGPSPARELPTARAEETASLGLGSAAILYARCTPGPGRGGVVRETRRAGERGDQRPSRAPSERLAAREREERIVDAQQASDEGGPQSPERIRAPSLPCALRLPSRPSRRSLPRLPHLSTTV